MKKKDLRNLPQVGKGVFTRCYQLDDETVLLESYDPIKKLMAEGRFPKSKLFPVVKSVKNPFGKGGDFYTMVYYKGRPARSTKTWLKRELDEDQYELYLELVDLRKSVEDSILGVRGVDRRVVWNEAFATLSNAKVGKLLIKANNLCCTVADNIMFDCAPKNVCPHNGKLVLLDCFYSTKLLYALKLSDKPEWALRWETQ